MTTNLNAVAGPSKLTPPPKMEPDSPNSSSSELRDNVPSVSSASVSVNKPGLSVDENGDVVKVPPFLQKLYNMVSDPGTDNLIYWSDSGDSFFDKVPQPQTGVLKTDNPNDAELWEFVNPFFKRGQPQLLCKVTRKNARVANPPAVSTGSTGVRASARQASQNMPGSGYGHAQYLITDGTTEGEAGNLVGPTGQQMIDLSAITSGIAAIQQTQASIGAELKQLQASNEQLWREALESQERNRKHSETIDLIVSFLERIFGTEGEGLRGLKEALRRGGLGRKDEPGGGDESIGKKRKRFGIDRMISDGREDKQPRNDRIFEISSGECNRDSQGLTTDASEDPFNQPLRRSQSTPGSKQSDYWSSASQRFQTLPSEDDSSPGFRTESQTPSSNSNGLGISSDPNALVPYLQNSIQGGSTPMSPTSTAAAASAFNLDPAILQTTIGSLLQSPAAAQMFLNSLNNSVQGQAMQTPTKGGGEYNGQPHFGLGGDGTGTNGQHVDPTLALFSPLPNHDQLVQNNEALMKSYQDAANIGDDVGKLQESIDSLVRSMGLEPAPTTDPSGANAPAAGLGTTNATGGGLDMGGEGLDGDGNFNVDDFLHHLSKDNEEPKEEHA